MVLCLVVSTVRNVFLVKRHSFKGARERMRRRLLDWGVIYQSLEEITISFLYTKLSQTFSTQLDQVELLT